LPGKSTPVALNRISFVSIRIISSFTNRVALALANARTE